MSGRFEVKQASNGEYMFNLLAGNNQVVLTSQQYQAKDGATNGIESVRTNGPDDERFERKESEGGQPYFVLKAANGQVIGRSQMYASSETMETGIASVKENASSTEVTDLTA